MVLHNYRPRIKEYNLNSSKLKNAKNKMYDVVN